MVVTIVGGGLSGVLIAVNLIRYSEPRELKIYLIERNEVCEGIAFSSKEDSHYLNVPVEKMSLFPMEPEHFYFWLKEKGYDYSNTDFVSRCIYKEYIQNTFEEIAFANSENVWLEVIKDESEDIVQENTGVTVLLKSGRTIRTDKVVLALGNLPPANPLIKDMGYTFCSGYTSNPWSESPFIKNNETVLMIGTGLTMVDMIMSLKEKGHAGKVFCLSRHGLLPHTHDLSQTYPQFNEALKNSYLLSEIFATVKFQIKQAEKKGIKRFAVIDSLRPYTQQLWQRFSLADKKQFLRHLKPYWDILRHRIPVQSSKIINELIQRGQLEILSGKYTKIEESATGFNVTFRNRKSGLLKSFNVNKIINCTGPTSDFENTEEPFIKNLVQKKLICNAPAGLGINATAEGKILNFANQESEFLFTLGPPLKGILWESTAVPEISAQAENLAKIILFEK